LILFFRASKLLLICGWLGRRYDLRFETVNELRASLVKVLVHVLLLDNTGFQKPAASHHYELLQKTVRDETSFAELGH